ncbi:hypothetical protein SRIM_021920 [Streptomyces rimosus subsp. rimosus ATCC 10970]|uniref:Uncharacterized protein n=1 Tax=Streptomyces rimosus subsp. rimosus (strain ATCC 10970 / DSM 40260 / JCM 4667 / NRRL 2234) TaxID=1265868 RepID=A0A8A1V502_STRR1|nr:hypothetical protein [Streptomyces sp. SID5471]QDA09657.1 hypothetical protein CTZ40_18865 [Streptomyces rimosus]QGY71203.1 hypothetical protein V519_006165 [Streptomyces rimosus R6-500]QST86072.1 hypothetical protein SRIM_021920 [Streptomyces rimosus subsp. rimosus ATCC 10970]QTL91701.1 hypothetical protein FMM49_19395 [Streptomyces rimosus subsp. rimosus]
MERDPTGARWFASYVRQPHKPGQPVELYCLDHPETRLMRVLGRAWTCPECVRARSKTGDP